MKPLFLKFSGLNSYRDQQYIDFSLLSKQGLFGIFGPTGAGKSTILDAITLALFGKVNRAVRATQGIINAKEKRCSVSFRFELNQHEYLAERVYERAKGEPFSSKFKSGRLILDDEKVLADRSDLINKEIISLLGMEHERFCQTVILPQGKFDQLLKLSPSERSAMLEELFHYQQYGDGLVQKLREKLKGKERECLSLHEQLSLLGDCGEKIIKEKQEDINKLEKQIKANQTLLLESETELLSAKERYNQVKQIELHKQKLFELDCERDKIDQLRKRLTLGEQAENLRSLIENAITINHEFQEAEQALQIITQKHTDALSLAESLSEKATRLQAEYKTLSLETERDLQSLYPCLVLANQLQENKSKLKELSADSSLPQLEEKITIFEEERKKKAKEITCLEEKYRIEEKNEEKYYLEWKEIEILTDQARVLDAVAYINASVKAGEICPVCGHLIENKRHVQNENHDINKMIEVLDSTKVKWDASRKNRQNYQRLLSTNKEQYNRLDQELHELHLKYSFSVKDLEELKKSIHDNENNFLKLCPSGLPELEIKKRKEALNKKNNELIDIEQKFAKANSEATAAAISLAAAETRRDTVKRQLDSVAIETAEKAKNAGFPHVNDARKALLAETERKEIKEKIRQYDEQVLINRNALQRIPSEIDATVVLNALTCAQNKYDSAQAERDILTQNRGSVLAELDRINKNYALSIQLTSHLEKAKKDFDILQRLADLLKGNAFVRYLAQGAMLELTYDASFILSGLTNGRYRLELVEDSKGNDFIIADDYQGGLFRQVNSLSGGETFLVSLALSLALSQKIQMDGAELGFFFLDEGFGSLDENALDAAISVLERLPSEHRIVGIITHVAGVKERIPCYLEVSSDSINGSCIEWKTN